MRHPGHHSDPDDPDRMPTHNKMYLLVSGKKELSYRYRSSSKLRIQVRLHEREKATMSARLRRLQNSQPWRLFLTFMNAQFVANGRPVGGCPSGAAIV